MKLFRQLSPLSTAVALSLLAHAALLGVRFAAPDSFKLKPVDPGLEVILVNAKHARAPLKADAVAQANLDGGGNAAEGRSSSPLPNLRKMETGESMEAIQRRIAELEEAQKERLTQARAARFHAPPVTDKDKPDPSHTGFDLLESSKAIARSEAEITQRIQDENKRPRKTSITPRTREAGYAEYYKTMQHRIEEIGTLNFPQQNGRKLYGELMVYIPVYQDGSIYEKEGGVQVERSSGNPALDRAALNIVRRAAPFGRFPSNMRSTDRDDVWVITTTFKFTREDTMQLDLRSGGQ